MLLIGVVHLERAFMDQMNRCVRLERPPRRIVSLVPSQTELLFDLGLGERVVGVTDFCIEPPDARTRAVGVGGTKRFLFDRIDALRPDLVIGNREENYVEGITRLGEKYPVWMSDISALGEALAMIEAIGEMCEVSQRAQALTRKIRESFDVLPRTLLGSAAYLIWKKPWMVAASGTFIDDMLRRAGFDNVFGDRDRYPQITLDELRVRAPRFVLLSSEPFPFDADHVEELAAELPDSRVLAVDAMPFSWYGARLRAAPAYFHALRAQCGD